ncbi:MAG: hypothetical protein E7661_04335 [Ruminococcaceae bacterium]|nr:hypothetical protein [Oscillospiraceae bacterium]
MRKRNLFFLAGLLSSLLISTACAGTPSIPPVESDTALNTTAEEVKSEAPTEEKTMTEIETFVVTETEAEIKTEAETEPTTEAEMTTEAQAETESEATTEVETEPETESPYLIPDPTRIDLRTFDEQLFKSSFLRGNSAYPEQCDEGIKFIGRGESRDPNVLWRINSMYKAAGYPVSDGGENYVPFTPEEKKVIVFKIQAEWGGLFEMFYATENRKSATAGYSMTEVYGGDSEFFGERVWQYIIFEADDTTQGWATRFNDSFRLDYTNFLQSGDVFLVEKIAFCQDRTEAEAFIEADKGEPEAPAEPLEAGYYVCLYEDRLQYPENNVHGSAFSSLESAIRRCDRVKHHGYRVANEKGEIVYTPYSLLQCNLLREGKYITEYAKAEGFKYGDSCTNPGINHRPHRTSCDRLVDWILYRAGFTDQPIVQGCVVSNLHVWCREMGFEKITSIKDLQAGDIVFVNPHPSDGGPQHVFMLAADEEGGTALRYDHGSDSRIMSSQPTSEPISYGNAPFVFAYRPVATEENNIYYHNLYAE